MESIHLKLTAFLICPGTLRRTVSASDSYRDISISAFVSWWSKCRLVDSEEVSYTYVKSRMICFCLYCHYLLTPWCRVLLEKLTGLQLVKKFPAFHGTRRFITALTSLRHLSLFWASPIQSIYPHPTYWRSVLILSTHLRLGLPSGSFPPVSPPRTYTPPLLTHMRHFVITSKKSYSFEW